MWTIRPALCRILGIFYLYAAASPERPDCDARVELGPDQDFVICATEISVDDLASAAAPVVDSRAPFMIFKVPDSNIVFVGKEDATAGLVKCRRSWPAEKGCSKLAIWRNLDAADYLESRSATDLETRIVDGGNIGSVWREN